MSDAIPADPVLCIRCSWPKDILSWVVAAPSLLLLGGIVALFVASFAGVVAMLVAPHPMFGLAVALPAFAYTMYRWAREHFGVSGDVHEFSSEGIRSQVQGGQRVDLTYDQIGSVRLLTGGRLQIQYGLPSGSDPGFHELHLPKLSASDQFDAIIEWIEEARPDHLFAADLFGKRHFSRPLSLESVFPDLPRVSGNARIDQLEGTGTLRVDGHEFTFTFLGYSTVLVYREDPEATVASAKPLLGAVTDYSANIPEVRVLSPSGLTLASTRLFAADFVALTIGEDQELRWELNTGALRLDGEELGTLAPDGRSAVLDVRGERPLVEVLVAFLLLCFFPRHLELARSRAS